MKKLICMILTMSMVLFTVSPVFATQVITFDEDGTGKVKEGETVQDATGVEVKQSEASTVSGNAYLALGSDLNQTQLNTVLELMGLNAADMASYNVVYVTNAEEHEHLDKYIPSSVIGTKSLSSVLVRPAEKGHGVVVTTKNVNYCTTNMYRNALITAGVEDADIIVAAPTQISGTAALIGALKAYEQMSGKEVSDKALDTALNELVTTGEISDSVGQTEAEELISYIKAQIAANDLNTEEEIEAAVRQGMKDLNVSLTEEEVKSTVSLMMKIKSMGIDFNVLAEQADDIYAKYKTQIDNGTFNINDVKLEDLGLGKIITQSVGGFFKDVGDSVKSFFGGLFKKK
ncbi:MAG: DUF1002 domain-containing protein [Lachnospiraceae bacterium]|nr:DUF1002 domain-containing protein [Lachnospiraceae bacterium]MCR4685549.1 DUF1002 domain-containing protein [Lachnospiraceae bacterium]